MGTVFLVLVLLICVCLFYWPTGRLTQTAIKYTNKRVRKNGKIVYRGPSTKQIILSYIPLYQIIMLRKRLYNGRAGFMIPVSIMIPVLIVFRLVVYMFVDVQLLWLISAAGMLLVLALHHILYAAMIFDVARMVQTSTVQRILALVVPYVEAFFLIDRLAKTLKQLRKERAMKGEAGAGRRAE